MEEITSLLAQYGLALVFANVLLTQLGAPVPAVPTLIVAGALAQQGQLSAAFVVAVAVAASLLGDLPWFVAGRKFGGRAISVVCRVAMDPGACVRQTGNLFGRWGAPSLLLAKFVPGFAMVAPPIAGALRLATGPFLAYSAGGALLWAGAAVAAGMIFDAQVDWAIRWLARFGAHATLVIGGVAVLFIAVKWIERRLLIRWLRMTRISVTDLIGQLQRPDKPVVLDARSSVARRLDPRRVPGAVAVDLEDLEHHLAGIARDAEIVIYCTCPDEASAARVARKLKDRGYHRVRALHGGLDAWLEGGGVFERFEMAV